MSVVLQIEIVEPDHDSSDSDYERKITLPQQCDRLPARGEIIEGVHLVKEDGLIRVLLCSEPEAAGHPRYRVLATELRPTACSGLNSRKELH